MIIIKGPGDNQPGIFNSVVRYYIEETSASIISLDTTRQLADINSLMGQSVNTSINTKNMGQGGTEQDISLPHILGDNSVQAVNAISTDYLDNFKPNKVIDYTVQPGDVISFIASDFGVSINSILWANKLSSPNSIAPGQVLRIPPVSGVIHTIQKGDTISSIAKKYGADTNKIITFNDLLEDGKLEPETDLIIPDGSVKVTIQPKRSIESGFISSVTSVAKRFAYLPDLGDFFKIPTLGFDWGIVHGRNGVDVANTCGTAIYAAANGTVITAIGSGWNGGFGKYIKISHENGTETLYGHLNKILIADGGSVTRGQEIGLMGSTGRSTGCHLHFEVHGARNPLAKY